MSDVPLHVVAGGQPRVAKGGHVLPQPLQPEVRPVVVHSVHVPGLNHELAAVVAPQPRHLFQCLGQRLPGVQVWQTVIERIADGGALVGAPPALRPGAVVGQDLPPVAGEHPNRHRRHAHRLTGLNGNLWIVAAQRHPLLAAGALPVREAVAVRDGKPLPAWNTFGQLEALAKQRGIPAHHTQPAHGAIHRSGKAHHLHPCVLAVVGESLDGHIIEHSGPMGPDVGDVPNVAGR